MKISRFYIRQITADFQVKRNRTKTRYLADFDRVSC